MFAMYPVREHPAPSGALRQDRLSMYCSTLTGQGAPSTIRCIKTQDPARRVRDLEASGSTQHHQVH